MRPKLWITRRKIAKSFPKLFISASYLVYTLNKYHVNLSQDPNSISRTFLEQLVLVDLIPVPGRRRWCLVSANLTGEASSCQPTIFIPSKGDLCEQCDADKKLCGEHSRLCPVHQVLSGVGKPCQVFFFTNYDFLPSLL